MSTSTDKPHIIFILADDMGWNDFSSNSEAQSPIPTPNIQRLANEGVRLQEHYMHSLCTPSRAALMTGRYHINTGLLFVLTPGTPVGIPDNIPTLPKILRQEADYNTAMVGKWHLGHGQHKLTPVGKGFETFTGIYMWDTDSYQKAMYELPWHGPLMIDWVQEHENGEYRHYAEPRHATEAIAEESKLVITRHANRNRNQGTDNPLFLYVAFTAAHSPLQPLPRHEAKCSHIPHLWRRQFCGMVVGLDEGVRNITEHAKRELGDNVIVVVTSDNGGSPWFGGNNSPLRGSKNTPFEGGVKVPAIVNDFTPTQKYLSFPQSKNQRPPAPGLHRVFHGMMHVSDWFPTLLGFAGVNETNFPKKFDGKDFSKVLAKVPYVNISQGFHKFVESPRTEMLVELQPEDGNMFHEENFAYRMGKYKLISGIVRDSNYYYESHEDRMNLSTPTIYSKLIENWNRLGDFVFGNNKFDLVRITFTHSVLQNTMSARQKQGLEETVRLYDLEVDPHESHNLANEPWAKELIAKMEVKKNEILRNRPPAERAHYQVHLVNDWPHTLKDGNCSMNPLIHPRYCKFTHPWIADDVDLKTLPLIQSDVYLKETYVRVAKELTIFFGIILIFVLGIYRRYQRLMKGGNKVKTH